MEPQNKIGNTVEQRGKDGCYTVDGTKLRSVTTYLGDVLGLPPSMVQYFHCRFGWEESQRLMKLAGAYGIEMHDALETYYFTDVGSVTADIARRIEHIDQYFEDNNIKPLLGEMTLWSFKLKTAGKCDFIGVDGKLRRYYVNDWKSGTKTAYKEIMQIATYGKMFIERQSEFDLPFPATDDNVYGLVCHIGKADSVKPKWDVYPPADMRVGLAGFKSIQKLYNMKRRYK